MHSLPLCWHLSRIHRTTPLQMKHSLKLQIILENRAWHKVRTCPRPLCRLAMKGRVTRRPLTTWWILKKRIIKVNTNCYFYCYSGYIVFLSLSVRLNKKAFGLTKTLHYIKQSDPIYIYMFIWFSKKNCSKRFKVTFCWLNIHKEQRYTTKVLS